MTSDITAPVVSETAPVSRQNLPLRVRVHPHYTRAKNNHQQALSVKVPGEPMYYYHAVLLENVRLVVRPSGWRRALDEGRRNVHAWAVGDWVEGQLDRVPDDLADRLIAAGWAHGHYNPFYGSDFKARYSGPDQTYEAVTGASAAFLWGFNCYLRGPVWK